MQLQKTLEIEIDGKSSHLSCEVTGEPGKPAVVLLHGWGSHSALMKPIARWLEPSHVVVNVDLPGHGRSPAPPVAWGVPEHADIVRQVLDQTVDGPFSIVGHSNGGRIALHLASRIPPPADLVSLVVISPSGVRRKRTGGYYVRRWTATALKAPFRLLPARPRAFAMDWLRHSLVWRLLGSADYRNVEGVMREVFVKTVNCYVESRLPNIRCPVLIFRGDNDDAVTAGQVERMENLIPDAGLVRVPEAGHYPFIDRPDLVGAATKHFLSAQ